MDRRRSVGFRAFALAWTVVFTFTGCASMAKSTRPLTPDEERMRAQARDFNRTIAEGVLIGAVVGAAGGAGIGAAANKKNRRQGATAGAIIGAAVGAVTGGAAGKYYADKKQRYASEEQRLDAMIADLQSENTKLEQLVATTRTVVDAEERKIDQIKEELAANKISKQEAQQRLASVDANREFLSDTVANLKKRRDEWQDIAKQARADINTVKIKQMDEQISRLQQQIALMEGEFDALTSRRASVVG